MLETNKLNESFAMHLVENGLLSEEGALQALDQQRHLTKPIGRLALARGYLTMKQVFRILHEQADSPLKFGELAINLGYLDNAKREELLTIQKESRPGICEILANQGLVKKGVLQKERRNFLRALEAVLV